MRKLASKMIEKIITTMQTPSNKADPKMSIKVSRAKTTIMDSDYWTVETIRSKQGLGDVSIAPRRFKAYGPPNRIYEIHVDNGVVGAAIREYPDTFKGGWKDQFTLGPGSSVSVAFDGYWEKYRDLWRLVTTEKPWISWVEGSGVLWTQLWDDESTRIQLATDVTFVRMIRAWKNVNLADKDQGIVAAYIKTDGKVYYRNYCEMIDHTLLWEPQRQVSEFTETAASLNLFITNDYRMGFVVSDTASQIHWIITDRNWAGMAITSETIKPDMEKSKTELIEIIYLNVFEPAETIKVLTPYSTGIEHIFHDVFNKLLWIKNINDGTGDWGRMLQFETLYPLHDLLTVNLFLEDIYFGMVIPVGSVTHLGGNLYQASVSEETLVGMNNAQADVRLTMKNLKTQLGLMLDDFSKEFTPVNLVPIEIPLPVVGEVWNE